MPAVLRRRPVARTLGRALAVAWGLCPLASRMVPADPLSYELVGKPPASRAAIAVSVNDADARGGTALRTMPEKKQGGILSDYYVYPKYPGRYRFTWRLKIDDNSGNVHVTDLCPLVATLRGPGNPTLSLHASDWKQPNVYQEFSVEGVVPEHDYCVFSTSCDPASGRAFLWDTGGFKLLESYDDARIASQFYPTFQLPESVGRTSAPELPRIQVLYHDTTYHSSRIRDALIQLGLKMPPPQTLPGDMRQYQAPPPSAPGQWTESAWIDSDQSRQPAPGFPDSAEALANLDMVILCDVPARAPSAPERLLLRQWVQQGGGGLLLTGGFSAFGRGYLAGTVFEEMLPVSLAGIADIRPVRDGRLMFKDARLAALVGSETLGIRFYHALPARPDAQVLIETGDGAPLLVVRSCGKGHVAVWLGTPLGGGFPAGQTAWWESDRWPAVLAEVCKRVAGK